MGVCGADPVAIMEGGGCLTQPDEDEQNTLRRLGFADSTRMACVARVQSGPVTVALKPEPGTPRASAVTAYDRSIVSVVVLGNGIAGVTAADFLRRGHPECEIHVVGAESHVHYNRMGISRLVFGRSAMQGLYLLPEQWYDDHQVVAWLNTRASRIDTAAKRVRPKKPRSVSRRLCASTGRCCTAAKRACTTPSSNSKPTRAMCQIK